MKKKANENWNTWQPGSGRKGWSPWGTGKPLPEVKDAETGHPIKDGKIDWARVTKESNEQSNNQS